MKHLFITISLCLLTSIAVASEMVEYVSYNITGFQPIFSDSYRQAPVTLEGKLYLPKGEGPFPVVVLQHGTGSVDNYRPWLKKIVPELNQNKLGAFVADSYSMRKPLMSNVKHLSLSARVLDGFQILNALSKHPNIDTKRIGIQGYSYGGMVAFFTAYKELSDQLAPGIDYAAHMPVYPGCDVVIKHMNQTAASIEMIVAELDDYAPAKDCIAYAPTIGVLNLYKGVHHGFVNAKPVKWHPDVGQFVKCQPGHINQSGNWFYNGKERFGAYSTIMSEIYRECGGQGVTTGGTKRQQAQLIEDTVRFFKQMLIEK